MALLRKIKLVSLILLFLASTLSAQDVDGILNYLKARNDSIKSFEIKLRQAYFNIQLQDYDAFIEDIEQLKRNNGPTLNITEQTEQLVEKWGKPERWFGRHTIQQGECFNETQTSDGTKIEINCYDGILNYSYSIVNSQFDIHSKVPNIKHANLSDIGFGFNAEALLSRKKILSFEQNNEHIQFVFTHMEDILLTMTQIYNPDLGLCYSQIKVNEQIETETYYLLHRNIEGYEVPRITININHDNKNNECDIWLYLIEDVKFNPLLTNKDFSIIDVPDKTLVVDYRFNPKKIEKYGEFRYAAYNPVMVQAGLREAEDLIEELNKTRSSRESLSTRDSRTGKKAPSLDIQQWLNKPINFSTWPPPKLTVVNFWDIDCSFCIREIPENNELYNKLEEKGIPFFSIHMASNDTDGVMNFIQTENQDEFTDINKIQYPVALDKSGNQGIGWNGATFTQYGINSVPCFVIIDEDGNVISYERSINKQNLEQILSGDKEAIARLQGKQKPARKLNAIPTGWLEDNLEPNSQIKGRFFIYREDTPDLVIRNINADKEIKSQLISHISMGQSIGELLLSAKAPDWGKSLKGNISITTEHSQTSEPLTIPYEIKSKSIVGYVSPVIWLGSVQNGHKITKTIQLHVDSNYIVSVNQETVPSNMQFKIQDLEEKKNNISIDCIFESKKTGFQQGDIELLVTDKQNNKESIKLEYFAFIYK